MQAETPQAETLGQRASIRLLGPEDVMAMHGLLDLYGEAFNEPETYGDARPDESYLRGLLGTQTFIALVAEHAGKVIGGLCAYVLPKFERARSEAYIYDLAVAECWRRRRIATRLIEALKPVCRQRGAWVIFVQADRSDAGAVALYERLGIREDPLHFDIPVA